MKRWGWLLVLAAAWGCTGGDQREEAKDAAPPTSEATSPLATEFTPESLVFGASPEASPIYTLVEDREVRVGDSVDEVYRLFPRPKLSFPMTEPPPGISSRFTVKGWESRLGAVGFIATGGRLALMLEILDQADPSAIAERVELTKRMLGEPTATFRRGQIEYWFWESSDSRKMICVAPDGQGRTSLAIALGHSSLMTALRMSPQQAQSDAAKAFELLQNAPKSDGDKTPSKDQEPAPQNPPGGEKEIPADSSSV